MGSEERRARGGGWLRQPVEGGGGRGAVGPVRDDHPPHTTLRHPTLAPRRTSIVHSGFVAFLAVSLEACPPSSGPRLEQQTRFFGEPPPVVGGLTREIYFGVFATCFATNVFHRNIFGERRFPRRRQERPPRRPPTIEIPCYFCVPQTPHCFPIAAIDRRAAWEKVSFEGLERTRPAGDCGQRESERSERARGAPWFATITSCQTGISTSGGRGTSSPGSTSPEGKSGGGRVSVFL